MLGERRVTGLGSAYASTRPGAHNCGQLLNDACALAEGKCLVWVVVFFRNFLLPSISSASRNASGYELSPRFPVSSFNQYKHVVVIADVKMPLA